MEVVKKRCSVRKYAAKPVPEEVLEEILEAGRYAPSGGNSQNYYFGVIREQQRKEQLAAAAGNQTWIASAPVIIAYCAGVAADLAEVPADDFGLIVNQTRFGDELVEYLNAYPDRKQVNTFWHNCAPLIPGEHIFLAAVEHGLHACWIGYLDIKRAGEILKLPEDTACLFLMPLGYAAEEPAVKEKKTLQELVFFEEWTEVKD